MASRRTGRAPAALTGLLLGVTVAAASAAPNAISPQPQRIAAPAETPQATGRLLATLEETGPRPIARLLARNDLRAGQRVPSAALVAVRPDPGQSITSLRSELAADPLVRRVDTEYYRSLRYVPNDPAYATPDPNAPGGDKAQWNLRRENFEAAWDISRGASTKVAIVDTGVSSTQPDLPIVAGDDNDVTGPTSGFNNDENGHGTHVAGLACGDSDNGYGIASSGFDCQIVAEKLDVSGNNLTDASVVAGIDNAVARGAGVINLSLGGGGASVPLRNAINNAWAHDVVVVTAAANPTFDGMGHLIPAGTDQGYPAKYVVPNGAGPDLATCPAGDSASFGCSRGFVVTMANYDDANAGSGTGSGISIAAYGDSLSPKPGIFSTFPAGPVTLESARANFGGDTKFAYLFGTSMATPQVTGLAALVRTAVPGMSAPQVVQTIRSTASGCGTWGSELGFGIIDAGRALALATGHDGTAPVSSARAPERPRKRRFAVKIESSDTAGGCAEPVTGVAGVSVFVARGRHHFRLLEETTKASIEFRGKRGRRYRFYTQARDGAGNVEADRGAPDVSVRVKRR